MTAGGGANEIRVSNMICKCFNTKHYSDAVVSCLGASHCADIYTMYVCKCFILSEEKIIMKSIGLLVTVG
jgi:hypothetical protein